MEIDTADGGSCKESARGKAHEHYISNLSFSVQDSARAWTLSSFWFSSKFLLKVPCSSFERSGKGFLEIPLA